ncbi:MAG TPA: dienelactone hydrolase family protein [Dongiaceae bacterium]
MGKAIELKAKDGFTLGAYRADPTGTPKGGLVVIQEIFGVNKHIRSVCDRFAEQGYVAISPAVFDRVNRGVELGYDKASIDEGVKIRAAISTEDSLLDVQAAIDAAKAGGKVGVVGYCWGGSLAFLAATRLSGLACAVGYYGGMIAKHADEKPKVPVMLHFGEKDHGIPMTDVQAVKAARQEVEVFTYNADHGFSCDERGSFDRASHQLALERTLGFFQKHLGK